MNHLKRIGIASIALAAGACSAALSQTDGTYLINVSGVASPSSPTVHIEIWSTMSDPGGDYYLGGGDYDLVAADGIFSNATVNPLLNMAAASTAGVVQGRRVVGAAAGQMHLPNFIWGVPDNPLLLASYDWTASNLTPRSVSLFTELTSNFIVADAMTGETVQLYPNEFTPGSGSITVVPAPAAWALMAAGFAASARRRERGSCRRRASPRQCGRLI